MATDLPTLSLMEAYNRRTPLRDLLINRCLDRPGTWKREEVSWYEIESMTGDAEWMAAQSQVYVGGESITVRDERTRYIHYPNWPCTNGELAREYLALAMGPKRRVPPRPEAFVRKPPLYCQPRTGELAYIDLRHAYWEIVKHYDPETALVDPGRPSQHLVRPTGNWQWPEVDEVDEDRRLRHSVVGILFSQGITYYHFGVPMTAPLRVGHHRPSLYRITMDTMHAIALDVKRHFELWGWLTDAAIVSAKEAEEVQQFLLDRWAFPSELKAKGRGTIYSVNSYRIGDHDDPQNRWTQDQWNDKGPRPARPEAKIGRVNVTFWRNERKRSVAPP